MSKPKTHVAIIMDRSGSMATIQKEAVTNYNEQVQQMKENCKDQDILMYLVTFNGSVYEHLWGVKANDVAEASESSYMPCGSTSLMDAIGYTIKKLQETTSDEGENVGYLLTIISDGEENTSSHYNASSIKEMIEGAQKTGKWTFSFMGCSEEYVKEVAHKTSIPLGNCAVWSNADAVAANSSFTASNASRGAYYAQRKKGLACSISLYSGEEGKMANFVDNSSQNTQKQPEAAIVYGVTNAGGRVPGQAGAGFVGGSGGAGAVGKCSTLGYSCDSLNKRQSFHTKRSCAPKVKSALQLENSDNLSSVFSQGQAVSFS